MIRTPCGDLQASVSAEMKLAKPTGLKNEPVGLIFFPPCFRLTRISHRPGEKSGLNRFVGNSLYLLFERHSSQVGRDEWAAVREAFPLL